MIMRVVLEASLCYLLPETWLLLKAELPITLMSSPCTSLTQWPLTSFLISVTCKACQAGPSSHSYTSLQMTLGFIIITSSFLNIPKFWSWC